MTLHNLRGGATIARASFKGQLIKFVYTSLMAFPVNWIRCENPSNVIRYFMHPSNDIRQWIRATMYTHLMRFTSGLTSLCTGNL